MNKDEQNNQVEQIVNKSKNVVIMSDAELARLKAQADFLAKKSDKNLLDILKRIFGN